MPSWFVVLVSYKDLSLSTLSKCYFYRQEKSDWNSLCMYIVRASYWILCSLSQNVTIYYPVDYSLHFLLIIDVSAPNSFTLWNPCFGSITVLLGVIPIKTKKQTIEILSSACPVTNYYTTDRIRLYSTSSRD